MCIVFVGIDLAKNVFAVHGINEAGKAELVRPKVAQARLGELMAALPPCTIGMEACSGAHHWARQFQAQGHTVKLMAPKFVGPYRLSGKRGKNDAADAQAICEAVQRPHMRFAPPEHRLARDGFDRHRLRRPQRRLRPGDAARPVGVALPSQGNPKIESADQGSTCPRGSDEAVRRGGPNGRRSHDLTAADVQTSHPPSWLAAVWSSGFGGGGSEFPMRRLEALVGRRRRQR